MVDVGNDFGLDGNAALLEEIDYSLVKQDEILDGFATKYRVGDITYGVVLAYNTEKTARQGARGLGRLLRHDQDPGQARPVEVLHRRRARVRADGRRGQARRPLPARLDRAIKKLDTIKDDIVWWESGAQSQELIGSGEVAMSMIWNGRGYSAKHTDGKPVEMQWNQQILTADYFVVPKGTPNKQVAMEFIAWATCANNNAAVSNKIPYGPTNKNSKANEAVVADLAVTNVDENTALLRRRVPDRQLRRDRRAVPGLGHPVR